MSELPEDPSAEPEYPPMILTDEMQYFIFETAKWTRLLSVFGFVLSLLIGMISFTISSVFPALVKASPAMGGIPGGAEAISVFYFTIAVVFFTFSLYLFQFSKGAREGISYNSEEQLTHAFTRLRSFFKLWGILGIIFVALYVFSLLSVLLGRA